MGKQTLKRATLATSLGRQSRNGRGSKCSQLRFSLLRAIRVPGTVITKSVRAPMQAFTIRRGSKLRLMLEGVRSG